MEEKNKNLVRVSCPGCSTILWVDPVTQAVVKSEKGRKKKGSLDELLLKEKKKKEAVDRRFETTAELEKKKRKAAEDQFAKAFSKLNKEG
jgi:hypothetical protein